MGLPRRYTAFPVRDDLIAEADAWVIQNTKRGLPAAPYHTCSGTLAICGNGPSLTDICPTVGPIAALNGAWRTIVARGTMPTYIVAFDQSVENLAWFEDAPVGPMYLLASCMHPRVFDLLAERGCDVRQWHTHGHGERNAGIGPLIGGGFTIGCASLNLFHLIGYDHFECYGMDSCYSLDGRDHATPQNWGQTRPEVFTVGEQSFLAQPWMAAQVEYFLEQIEAHRRNYTVEVHGDGMLKVALEHNTLDVVYDLDVAPGSFDFMCSMLNVENYREEHGYSRVRVHFKAGSDHGFRPNEPIDVRHEHKSLMLNNVVRPLLKMFGMEESGDESTKAMQFVYSPKPSLEYFNETGRLPEYRESPVAREWAAKRWPVAPYTITLREAHYWPQRNSDVGEWLKFAATLDAPVVFVRDTEKADEPLDGFATCPEASRDLDKRLALYRHARMNFFVTNGPGGLAWYSRDIPYLNFYKDAPGYHCYDPAWMEDYMGLPQRGQYPWASARQRLVYENDTCENIAKAWAEMAQNAKQGEGG